MTMKMVSAALGLGNSNPDQQNACYRLVTSTSLPSDTVS